MYKHRIKVRLDCVFRCLFKVHIYYIMPVICMLATENWDVFSARWSCLTIECHMIVT